MWRYKLDWEGKLEKSQGIKDCKLESKLVISEGIS